MIWWRRRRGRRDLWHDGWCREERADRVGDHPAARALQFLGAAIGGGKQVFGKRDGDACEWHPDISGITGYGCILRMGGEIGKGSCSHSEEWASENRPLRPAHPPTTHDRHRRDGRRALRDRDGTTSGSFGSGPRAVGAAALAVKAPMGCTGSAALRELTAQRLVRTMQPHAGVVGRDTDFSREL